jgi:hypothetical protein
MLYVCGMNGVVLGITAESGSAAGCIEAILGTRCSVARKGRRLTAGDAEGGLDEPSLSDVLNALEDCLTENRLGPVRISVDGKRYMMYARADA